MKNLKNLGSKISTPLKPNVKTLEGFLNPGVESVEFKTKEFTSLCPVTGQPDFVEVRIEYVPYKLCLESKSLKLYLQSYRNKKGFIEQLACKIHDDIRKKINPTYLLVTLESVPRGGVALKTIRNSYWRSDEA